MTQHSCISDVLSHKYIQWHDTTVDFITNKALTIAKGEIITRDPEGDSRRVNEIVSRGAHGLKSRPCNVTEVHEHEGRHHVHFTCSLPYSDIDDMFQLLSDIVEIKRPA